MTTLQSQLDQVLAPCPFCGGEAEMMVGYHAQTDAKVGCVDCCSEGPLFGSNDHDGGDHTKEAAAAWNKRAAVGGEAVAWRMLRANGKPYTGWKDLPVPEWASINVDDGMRLEYAYASPPATVDVGALLELVPGKRPQEVSGDGLPNCCAAEWNRCCAEVERRIAALVGESA